MRVLIEVLPLREPVCDLCLEALAENFGWFAPRDEALGRSTNEEVAYSLDRARLDRDVEGSMERSTLSRHQLDGCNIFDASSPYRFRDG